MTSGSWSGRSSTGGWLLAATDLRRFRASLMSRFEEGGCSSRFPYASASSIVCIRGTGSCQFGWRRSGTMPGVPSASMAGAGGMTDVRRVMFSVIDLYALIRLFRAASSACKRAVHAWHAASRAEFASLTGFGGSLAIAPSDKPSSSSAIELFQLKSSRFSARSAIKPSKALLAFRRTESDVDFD